MKIECFFSSPEGDIPIGPEEFSLPFKISPSEDHPFLTLKDYFLSIQEFIVDNSKSVDQILTELWGRKTWIEDIVGFTIRSEKHGAFYHIASVELKKHNVSIKLAVSTALSGDGLALVTTDLKSTFFRSRRSTTRV